MEFLPYPNWSMFPRAMPLQRRMRSRVGFICGRAVDDRPGQLAKVAECLADRGISLATVSQTPHEKDKPPV